MTNTARLQKPTDDEPTRTDDGCCPTCGDAVYGVETHGPGERHYRPCGHRPPAQYGRS